MSDSSQKDSILLCGRKFTARELDEVKETVELFPSLSLNELAFTICEGLSWYTPNGSYKVASCKELLQKLEKNGFLILPEKRSYRRQRKEDIRMSSRTDPKPEIRGDLSVVGSVHLEAVYEKTRRDVWNEYIKRYHPIGYKRPFGAYQRYIIQSSRLDQPLGCLLFSAAAWALNARDAWIGWSPKERSQRLSYVVNNSRFLLFPWVKVKHLASHVLSLAAKQIRPDWQARYGYEPVLLETFVDVARYKGTSYQASNWIYLGQTAGRGRMDRYTEYLSTPKAIYMYPLRRDFRAILCLEGGADQ